MFDRPSQWNGVRVVAIYEAAKAVLALIVGFGLLSLIDHDAEAFAVSVVKSLHANPASHYPRLFIEAARQLTKTQLWLLALLAIVDAAIRGVQAVGLWHNRSWAKWIGVIGSGIFLPIEIYELWLKITWLKSAAFITNIVIVVYLAYSLRIQKTSASEYEINRHVNLPD